MGRGVVRITRVKGPRRGNFVVKVTNKYSSFSDKVKLFKVEILYLTVYNNNYNKNNDGGDDDDDNNNNNQGNRGEIRQRTLVGPFTKICRNKSEGKVATLWNHQVRTDRTIPNNKPDNIIRDNKQDTSMLIDVAIPGDRNVIKKKLRRS
jgi:hypothetical protein